MGFTHHSNEPVDLAMALVNTDQRSIGGEDEIGDVVSLNVLLKDYKDIWGGVARGPTLGELAAIHQLRAALRAVFSAKDEADISLTAWSDIERRVSSWIRHSECLPVTSKGPEPTPSGSGPIEPTHTSGCATNDLPTLTRLT